MDDGSTDDSLDLCRKYTVGDTRFVVLSQENKGSSEARNLGLSRAMGSFICFADVDDSFNENYLADLMKLSQQGDLVIQGRIRVTDGKIKVIPVSNPGIYNLKDDPDTFFNHIDISNYGAPYCKLFSRDIIKSNHILFSTKILVAEDFDFLIRYLACCDRVVLDDRANYHYIDNKGSLSTRLYSFEKEYYGLRQIDSSWQLLNNCFHCRSLEPIYGKTIAYHVYRSICGIYQSSLGKKERIRRLERLYQEYGVLYKHYRKPETLFLRCGKSLFCLKQFNIFDLIMNRKLK